MSTSSVRSDGTSVAVQPFGLRNLAADCPVNFTAERSRLLSAALTILPRLLCCGSSITRLTAVGQFRRLVEFGPSIRGLGRLPTLVWRGKNCGSNRILRRWQITALIREWPVIDVDKMGVTAAERRPACRPH